MKRLIDVITVLLLAGAFVMAYYVGFCGKLSGGEPMLATNVFAIISMAGAALLFAVGALSAFITRVQRNMVTVWSVISTAVQFVAVVGICSIMSMLWMGMFELDNTAIRVCYIVFIVIVLLGYIDALLFADNLARMEALKNPLPAAVTEKKETPHKDTAKPDSDTKKESFLGF